MVNPKKKHTGIDIAAPAGADVFAAMDGQVKKIGWLDPQRKWAQYIDISHEPLNCCSSYLHVTPKVKVGDKVKAGEAVGQISTLVGLGSHLHFNIWEGLYDPLSHRGALPSAENAGKVEPISDPAFPGGFIDPAAILKV